jgi:hypothetical protein
VLAEQRADPLAAGRARLTELGALAARLLTQHEGDENVSSMKTGDVDERLQNPRAGKTLDRTLDAHGSPPPRKTKVEDIFNVRWSERPVAGVRPAAAPARGDKETAEL